MRNFFFNTQVSIYQLKGSSLDSSKRTILSFQGESSGVRDMNIERRPCQIMLKSDFFHFFTKKIFSEKFEHTIGFVLKNAIIGKKNLLDNLKGLA